MGAAVDTGIMLFTLSGVGPEFLVRNHRDRLTVRIIHIRLLCLLIIGVRLLVFTS